LLGAIDPVLLCETLGVDGVDLRKSVRRRVVMRVGVGEIAELSSEGDLALVVERLITEEHDLPLVEGLLY
jgi:hypothetical protein